MNKTIASRQLSVGKRLQRRRRELGLSIEKLARNSQVNKNTILRVEKGANAQTNTIEKICAALETSYFDLLDARLDPERDFEVRRIERDEEGKPVRRYQEALRAQRDTIDLSGVVLGDLQHRWGALNATVLEIHARDGQQGAHRGEELLFCLTGAIGVRLGDNIDRVLKKGDAMFFDGEFLHAYYNADSDKEVSVGLSVWVDADADG